MTQRRSLTAAGASGPTPVRAVALRGLVR